MTPDDPNKKEQAAFARMKRLIAELQSLEDRLRQGGGPKKIDKQHDQGKLTARERIARLIDPGTLFLEVGLLIAHDKYDGQAPAAGVVTGVGRIEGRPAVMVANDATVKAGAWWPETITKILRAQEIAMRNRVPIVYLVDSAGVNLPYQDGIFPGQYGAGRIFYYNSLMRRRLRVPQIAAVMGPCIAGGAYLPALSDVIIMVESTSFMGLGGPNLVKGATGQVIDAEPLGGARMHTAVSGVAHYMAKDDADCLARIRAALPRLARSRRPPPPATAPARPADDLYGVLPADHRLPYDVEEVVVRIFDGDDYLEFQPEYAPEMLCANARLCGLSGGGDRQPPRLPARPTAGRASAASSTPNRRARWPISSKRRTRSAAAGLPAGRFRFHGRRRRPSARASSAPARRWWRPWPAPPCRRSSSP